VVTELDTSLRLTALRRNRVPRLSIVTLSMQRLRCFLAGMRAKLGLLRQLDGDADLVRGLTTALQASY